MKVFLAEQVSSANREQLNKDIQQIFLDRLYELVKEKEFNLKTLSDATGIPRTTINSWKLKKRLPSAECLLLLADCFCVSIDYLLGRED